MLTQKQKGLFDILKVSHDHEKGLRDMHKMVREHMGEKRPFTKWLEKFVKEKWRREHERLKGPYLGD